METERQSQNWVSVAEIQELIDELSAEVKALRGKAQLIHQHLQTALWVGNTFQPLPCLQSFLCVRLAINSNTTN
eukprot:COSAG02_NODE_6734_length_3394_cov_2.435508_4_plen_74_part_00